MLLTNCSNAEAMLENGESQPNIFFYKSKLIKFQREQDAITMLIRTNRFIFEFAIGDTFYVSIYLSQVGHFWFDNG